MVKKALITPVRERWVVKIKGGPDLEVQGNILDHEYTIGEGRDKVAEVSKKWFRLRDSYGVSIDPGPGRCADPGRGRVHRRDGSRRTITFTNQSWQPSTG